MAPLRLLALALLLTASLPVAHAQTSEAEPSGPRTAWVYTEAYRCDWTRLREADSLYTAHFEPVFEAMKAEGKLLAWSYMRRSFGDEWNRVLSFTVPQQEDFFPARNEAGGRFAERDPEVWGRWFAICGDHRENLYRSTVSY